ncbi:MAG: hypothetical protein ACUZ8H_16455 [Candidatus Anammoxibacter sp.]
MRDYSPIAEFTRRCVSAGKFRVYTEQPADKSKSVILTFDRDPTAGRAFNFIFDRTIKNVKGIKALSATDIVSVYSRGTTYTLPTSDEYAAFWLYLLNKDSKVLCTIPINTLLGDSTNGKPTFFNLQVDWQNSYILSVNNAAGLTTANALLFQIWYD